MRRAVLTAILGLAATLTAFATDNPPNPSPSPRVAANMKLSGPYTHGNLTIFLIHGPDAAGAKPVLTLKEALEQKVAVVHETSNVNLLAVENTSPDREIFIMAGDVVKGGKQDRAIAFDLIVPPKSGALSLPSFCVEHGRWQQRGAEAAGQFACSDSQVCGRGLKLALNEKRAQGEVWKEVDTAQKKLSDNTGKDIKAAASPSSLQLALEDKDLQSKLGEYEKELVKALGDKNVIGVAYVVNGEVTGADTFSSAELCRKLWPKLLRSAAAEALGELKADKKFEPAKPEAVTAFLTDAERGAAKEVQQQSSGQQLHSQTANAAGSANVPASAPPKADAPPMRVRIMQYTSPKTLLVFSQDKDKPEVVWHRCYVAK